MLQATPGPAQGPSPTASVVSLYAGDGHSAGAGEPWAAGEAPRGTLRAGSARPASCAAAPVRTAPLMRQQTDRERQRRQSRTLTREAPGPWPRPHCATAVSGQRRALTALPGTAGRTASGHARPGPLAAPLPVSSLRPSVSPSLLMRPGT